MEVSDINYVGQSFENISGYEYKVIEKIENKRYIIKFVESNYKAKAYISNIKAGKVKDRYSVSVQGVGILGDKVKPDRQKYEVWRDMLERCYCKTSKIYKGYGGRGVKVSKDWLIYSNFYYDIEKLEGWDEEKFRNNKLILDKDKKQINKKYNERIYSKNTCVWLNYSESSRYTEQAYKPFKAISPTGKIYFNHSQTGFANKHGLSPKRISDVLNNVNKTHKGWKFNWITKEEYLNR